MQENEFEKQVKNMMGEFQLPPLDTAWEKVSRKINEDKRKKRYFIFFLFLGLIAAGVSGYFISEKNIKQSTAVTAVKKDELRNNHNIIAGDSNKNFIKKTLPAATAPTTTVAANSNSNNANKSIRKLSANTAVSKSINNKNIFKEESKSNKNLKTNTTNYKSLPAYKSEIALSKNKNRVEQINTPPQNFSNNNTENNNPFFKDSASSKEGISINNILPAENNNHVDSNMLHSDPTEKIQPFADSITAKKQEKKSLSNSNKIPNWQWGVNAFYGRSNLAESIVDFNKSVSVASAAFTNGNITGGGRLDSFNNSKLYTSSSACNIGVVVQRKILRNAVIGAGINYEHLSVESHISSLVNSGFFLQYDNNSSAYIINSFYRPGNASVYTNNFNFIEVPVYFQQDIFHAKKVSFAYNAGFSIRQLLSSKALIYNEANGIYYFKDGLLHKTQLQLQGGFKIKFNTGKSTSLYVGPQFSYSLSNGFKNANDGTFHFINYGLQAGLLLHKK